MFLEHRERVGRMEVDGEKSAWDSAATQLQSRSQCWSGSKANREPVDRNLVADEQGFAFKQVAALLLAVTPTKV